MNSLRYLGQIELDSFESLPHAFNLNGPLASNEILFGDLFLGSWRPHHLGHQLLDQLDIDFPELARSVSDPLSFGGLLDFESRGDSNKLLAFRIAESILSIADLRGFRKLCVIPQRGKNSFSGEDLQLMEFLDAGINGKRIEIELLSFKGHLPNPPEPSQIYRIPGIIKEAWLGDELKNGNLIKLANGFCLIDPRVRPVDALLKKPIGVSGVDLEDWLWVCFYAHDKNDLSGFMRLIKCSDAHFVNGAINLALLLIELELKKEHPPEVMGALQFKKASIQINSYDFSSASRLPLPDRSLPNELIAGLLKMKAWGLLMVGQEVEASKLFHEVDESLELPDDSEIKLGLWNITALCKLKLGEIEAAKTLEKKIEGILDRQNPKNFHFQYINFINQARIYKKEGLFDSAEIYYMKAFATNEGVCQEPDLLYQNLCLAQLSDFRGNFEESQVFWFRVVLHWLSNPLPEALPNRVRSAILGGLKVQDDSVEEVSQALFKKLIAIFPEDKRGRRGKINPDARFERYSGQREVKSEIVIGGPGWSVVPTLGRPKRVISKENYLALTREAIGVLQSLTAYPVAEAGAIFVDSRFGFDISSTKGEMLWLSVRLNSPEIDFLGTRLDVKSLVSDRAEIFVRLSRAISLYLPQSESVTIFFKRYHSPLKLRGRGFKLFMKIAMGGAIDLKGIIFTFLNSGEIDPDLEGIFELECSSIFEVVTNVN